jgi:hypothetical protein
MPEPPASQPQGVITIAPGRPLSLGDLRAFLELMDAAGASDEAPVWASAAPKAASKGRGARDEFPGGLTELTGLGGFPRASRGTWPGRGRLADPGTRPRPEPLRPQVSSGRGRAEETSRHAVPRARGRSPGRRYHRVRRLVRWSPDTTHPRIRGFPLVVAACTGLATQRRAAYRQR